MGMSTITLAATVLCLVAGTTVAEPQARPRRDRPIRLIATGYCSAGRTRSGALTSRGMIAADPRVLPVGSVVRIDAPRLPGTGTYIVADTGSSVKGHRIDIYMPSCSQARRFGRHAVVAHLVRRGTLPPAAVGRRLRGMGKGG